MVPTSICRIKMERALCTVPSEPDALPQRGFCSAPGVTQHKKTYPAQHRFISRFKIPAEVAQARRRR
jgi:hypothetical protein